MIWCIGRLWPGGNTLHLLWLELWLSKWWPSSPSVFKPTGTGEGKSVCSKVFTTSVQSFRQDGDHADMTALCSDPLYVAACIRCYVFTLYFVLTFKSANQPLLYFVLTFKSANQLCLCLSPSTYETNLAIWPNNANIKGTNWVAIYSFDVWYILWHLREKKLSRNHSNLLRESAQGAKIQRLCCSQSEHAPHG